MIEKIRKKRKMLYEIIDKNSIDSEEALDMSKQLDNLIWEYYQKTKKTNKIR